MQPSGPSCIGSLDKRVQISIAVDVSLRKDVLSLAVLHVARRRSGDGLTGRRCASFYKPAMPSLPPQRWARVGAINSGHCAAQHGKAIAPIVIDNDLASPDTGL